MRLSHLPREGRPARQPSGMASFLQLLSAPKTGGSPALGQQKSRGSALIGHQGGEPLSLLAVCRPGTSVVRVPHSHQGLYISSGCKHAAAEESTELWGLARQGTPRSHPIWPSRKTTEPPWVSTLSCARLGLILEHSLCSVISQEDPAEEATCPILDHASVEVVCAKERSQGGPAIITPCLGARGACTRTFVSLPHAYYVHYVPTPQP